MPKRTDIESILIVGAVAESPPPLWGRVREGGMINQWSAKSLGSSARTSPRPSSGYGHGSGADNSADVIFGAKPLSEITSSTLPASSGISWSRWTAASIRSGWRKTQKGPSGSRARATGSFAFGTMTCSRTWTGSWTRFWRRFGNHKNTPSLTLPHQQGGGSRLWRRPRLYSLRSKSSGVVVPVRTSAKASSASLARTS